jgi:ubiquinone/menaquinone biosynthesis C-methylase UbiE
MFECKSCSKYVEGLEKVNINKLLSNSSYNGDIELRWQTTNGIIDRIIRRYNNPKIIDLAMGSGEDALYLLKKGYAVALNEVDENFIPVVRKKVGEESIPLDIRIGDWKDIIFSNNFKDNEFNFAYILGNSFPNYFFNEKDREISLKGFWRIIKPRGTLFFDTRNFDYMLNDREYILKDAENNFIYNGSNTYLKNKDYKCFPTKIEDQLIHWCVKDCSTNKYGCIDLWPATEKRIREMIENSIDNFSLEIYYDYQKEKPEHYDFIQYEIVKI